MDGLAKKSTGYDSFPEGVSSGLDNSFSEFSLSQSPLLSNRRALITGGAIGVGRGIALELAREGVEVAIHYVNEEEQARLTQLLIAQAHGKAHTIRGDFSEQSDIARILNQAEQALGKIDILVNNAGITSNAPFLEVTPEFYDKLFGVNLKAMYFLTQQVAKKMKQQGGGTVINMASLHASFAMNEHSVYAMTKAAVTSFTRNVALELAPHNIRVNAISPGWCFGENHLRLLGNGSRLADAAQIPAGYIANPTTVGRLAVHLCLPDLNYFVGQTLVYDGGQSAIMPNTGAFNTPQSARWGGWYLDSSPK